MTARRSYGTGALEVRADRNGRETWYGRWHTDSRRVKRCIGPKRTSGQRDGLTRAQAESRLRQLMAETTAGPAAERSLTVGEMCRRYLEHLEAMGRKRTTIVGVESTMRVWLVPVLGDKPAHAVTVQDVEDLMRTMRAAGVKTNTVRTYVGTLSSIYRYAQHPRRGWVPVNPCAALELPPKTHSTEIRYLTVEEARALVAAAVSGDHHGLDRALYLTATMTGLRQGELIALRWMDVDWPAQRVRVRRNHTVGGFGTPKTRRGSRSVPMSAEVAGELARLQRETRFGDDEDLVFGEPATGEPLRRGALMRRYRRALKAAQLDVEHRFHDLRHTFGTTMAGAGVPMRTLQEWMGHEHIDTTSIYADYAPNPREVEMVEAAFAPRGPVRGPNLSEPHIT